MKDLGVTCAFGLLASMLVGCSSGDRPPSAKYEVEGSSTAQEATASEDAPSSARFDDDFEAAGSEHGVPGAVLKAIAWTETRFEMVKGEVEHEGRPAAFGMMALSGSRLEDGARLANVSVDDAKTISRANIRAAAALLAQYANELAIDRTRVSAWAPVIERFSGIEGEAGRKAYAKDDVFAVMKRGLGNMKADGSQFDLFGSELEGPLEPKAAGPDYAGSIWRASPNWNSRGSAKPAMVIIHTCEGSYTSCWSWLQNSAAQASAHYVVREDGLEISQLVREANRAWHIAASYNCNLNGGVDCFRNGTSANNFTIGIEHAGYASQKSFPAGQIDASARLVCNMSKTHGIPRDRFHIVGHGKLQPYDRTDPGANWPWTSYIQKVNDFCGSGGGGGGTPPPPSGDEIVIDSNNANNDQAKATIEVSQNWTASTNISGYWGSGYWWADAAPVADGATFWFWLPAAATKTVDAHWSAASDRSSSAPFVMFDALGNKLGVSYVDQRYNGGQWNTLGSYAFTAGWNKVVLSRWTGTGSIVVADAVRVH